MFQLAIIRGNRKDLDSFLIRIVDEIKGYGTPIGQHTVTGALTSKNIIFLKIPLKYTFFYFYFIFCESLFQTSKKKLCPKSRTPVFNEPFYTTKL